MPNTQSHPKAHRVLVVDDDPSTLRLLEVVLRDRGMEPVMACGSIEAKEWVERTGLGGLDCAIVDYRMPKMNGLQLVTWLMEQDSTLALVMMTAEGDIELVTGALRSGVVDYIEKPFHRTRLLSSLDKAAGLTAERRYLASAAEELRDITVIHNRLVPRHDVMPPSFASGFITGFETAFHPAHESGGDFVNCFPIDNHRLLVVTGDVSGHDLKAGFISSYFQGMCRGMIAMNADIRQVRQYFNHFLHNEWNPKRVLEDGSSDVLTSLSVCFLLLDFSRMSLLCLNNGFPTPTLCAGDLAVTKIGDGGPPLGWFGNPETREVELPLPRTGSIALYSDGLIDHAAQIDRAHHALAERLFTTVGREYLRGQRDDVLGVRISWRREDRSTPAPRLIFFANYSGSDAEHIDVYQEDWDAALQLGAPDVPQERRRELLLCCREALLNAMIHGSGGAKEGRCRLTIALRNERVAIRVEDEGPGYPDNQQSGTFKPGAHVSMGLRIIHCYATHCETGRNGARITMEFSLDPQHA